MEVFYLFNIRYLGVPSLTLEGVVGTRAVLIAIGAVTGLQFLFTYAPFMHTLFETRPLSVPRACWRSRLQLRASRSSRSKRPSGGACAGRTDRVRIE
jgi:magnesium-transporting ATPase (P-type)